MKNIIKTDRLLLRPWQWEDAEDLCQLASNRNTWLKVRDSFPHPYGKKNAETWITKGQPASSRVLEKAGFVLEGRIHKKILKEGKIMDAFLYALFSPNLENF